MGLALALIPLSSSTASPTDGSVTVNDLGWEINASDFGVEDVEDDAYDGTYLELSVDNGANWVAVECVDGDDDGWINRTALSGGAQLVSCRDTFDTGLGLAVDPYAVVSADGLNVATTYKITNTSGSAVNYLWRFGHNYGQGNINAATYSSVFSLGDGSDENTTPAAAAWGPTSSACPPAVHANDGYDDMLVTSAPCALADEDSTALTFFHLIDVAEDASTLLTSATSKFVTRSSDVALAAMIPAGLYATNWDLGGTLALPNLTESMTLTGDTQLGNYMTVSFSNSEVPYGSFYDIWVCPNTDTLPVAEAEEGDCIAWAVWDREQVANYDQETSALTMTWQLSNEAVPGLVSEGGLPYLDGTGEPIMVDPAEGVGGWCQYEGWYLVVNDFQDGLHSNFSDALSATGCSDEAPAEPTDSPAALAATGSNAEFMTLFGVLALLVGLGLTAARRRMALN